MTPLNLRCSALPLAFKCPGSVRREGLEIDDTGADARLGSAAHVGLATVAETGAVDWSDVPAIARRFEVAEADVRLLLALGLRLWESVGALLPDPATERELEYRDPSGAFVLTGHADVVSWLGRLVRVADWKTGRRDSDYSEQLRGYCWLALDATGPEANAAEALILWVRDGEVERYAMSRADATAWLARLRSEIVEWDGRYHVGAHCGYCPRNHECPAGLALARRDVVAMSDAALAERLETGDALAAMAPGEVVALLEQADHAADVAGRVRTAIRAFVAKRGDVVGNGHRLTLQLDERRTLDVLAAFPLLVEAGFDDSDFAEVITLSLPGAERVVKRKAERGKGAAAARELEATLDAAGAIQTTTTTKLVVKRHTEGAK